MISEVEREKRREYIRCYYKKNRERWLEYVKARRRAHGEEIREKARENYALTREEKKAYLKKWKPQREAAMGETYSQKFYRENPDYMREYIKKNKAYAKARSVTYNAIKSGKLVRLPCENCGEQQSEAHHTDYNKPLEVMWLCKRCHEEWHRNHTAIPPKDS